MLNHLQRYGSALPPVLSSSPPAASLWGDVHSGCAVAALEIRLVNPPVRDIIFLARRVCVKSSNPQREWKPGGGFSGGCKTRGFQTQNLNVLYFCYFSPYWARLYLLFSKKQYTKARKTYSIRPYINQNTYLLLILVFFCSWIFWTIGATREWTGHLIFERNTGSAQSSMTASTNITKTGRYSPGRGSGDSSVTKDSARR